LRYNERVVLRASEVHRHIEKTARLSIYLLRWIEKRIKKIENKKIL